MGFADVNSFCYLATFFCFAMFETLLCSGITYGWASIVYVFKTEFFFMDLCKDWYARQNKTLPRASSSYRSLYGRKEPSWIPSTHPPHSITPVSHLSSSITTLHPFTDMVVRGGAGFVDDGKLPGCPAQDARLNLVFTISLFCLCGIKFPAGVFIDRCGPRIARTVGG